MRRFLQVLPLLVTTLGCLKAQEFPITTPESEGMNSEMLTAMSQRIRNEGWDIRAVLVLRHGRLVLEWMSGGVTRDHNHNVFSITKSVVATLAGVALDQKLIPSEATTLGELFPETPALRKSPEKSSITLEHLLTMRSGLPVSRANEPSGPSRDLFDWIHGQPDRLAWMLKELRPRAKPGSEFRYNNIDPALVLAAIEERSKESATDFARRRLFEPLSFKNARWMFADMHGRVPGGYGLRLRAIDLAKLGQLHLQNGTWNGRRVLSGERVRHATSNLHGDGYGCFWWIDEKGGSYSAKGVRGQRLVVHPLHALVFVILSDLPPAEVQPVTKALEQEYLLKAIVSAGGAIENTDAWSRLRAELVLAQKYQPASRQSLPVSRLPQR